jgi:hypothetical protein
VAHAFQIPGLPGSPCLTNRSAKVNAIQGCVIISIIMTPWALSMYFISLGRAVSACLSAYLKVFCRRDIARRVFAPVSALIMLVIQSGASAQTVSTYDIPNGTPIQVISLSAPNLGNAVLSNPTALTTAMSRSYLHRQCPAPMSSVKSRLQSIRS